MAAVEEGVARATGNVIDRVQRTRNKLVQLAQDGDDDDRAFATAELKKLNDQYSGLSRPGENPGKVALSDKAPPADARRPEPAPTAPFKGTGYRGKVEESSIPGVTALRKIDNAVGGIVLNPKKMLDPAWRLNALSAYDKGFTGGLGTKAAEKLDGERMAQAAKTPLDEGEAEALHLAGMISPRGLASGVARAGQKALLSMPWLAKAAGAAPKAVGAGVGAASAGAAGGAQAGTETLTGSKAPMMKRLAEAGRAAVAGATDLATLVLGGVGGAIQGAGAGMRARNPDVQTIESRGGTVSLTSPGKGGAMESPLVQSGIEEVPGLAGGTTRRVTERGKGHVARQSADAVANTLEGKAKGVRQQLQSGMDDAAGAGKLDAPQDVTDLYVRAQQMAADPKIPGDVRARIKSEILDDIMDPAAAELGVGPGQPFTMAAGDVNQLKQKIQYFAKFLPQGKGGKSDPYFSQLSHEASGAVGDDIGKLNEAAEAGFADIETARKAMGIPGNPKRPISAAERNTLSNTLGRRGADTRTAGKDINPELETVMQKFPELRQYIEAPELLQARSNLEFGAGAGVGGLLEKVKAAGLLGVLMRNISPLQARVLAPALEKVGTATRSAAPAPVGQFIENLGAGERRRQEQR